MINPEMAWLAARSAMFAAVICWGIREGLRRLPPVGRGG